MRIILLMVCFISGIKGKNYFKGLIGDFFETSDYVKDTEVTEHNPAHYGKQDHYLEPDHYGKQDLYGEQNHYGKQKHYGKGRGSLPCGTDLHTCVPYSDCNERTYSGAKTCPQFFTKIGGACYYISIQYIVKGRSRPEAQKFCEALGGSLAFIESKEEFNELSSKMTSGNSYWTEGFYNPRQNSWVWETSKEEINFKFVHPETGQLEDIKDPSKDSYCLSFNETGLYPTSCFTANPFVCKEGHYDNTCEKYRSNKCCFIPSYEFYIKNLNEILNQNIRAANPCYVTYNTQTITCADAYKALERIPATNFRIENSIYYMMPADEGCGKNTEAVISSRDLHTFLVRYLSLLENLNVKLRIGLHGTETPTQIKFKWANGKSIDLYDKYWALGHPQLQSKAKCVMYDRTGEGGSYLWHTQQDEEVCYDPRNQVVCQLPMRNNDYKPNFRRSEGCGERKSRGVLGRSYSFTSVGETNFGELPWQAAISISGSSYGGVSLKFACSGVLISYDSILTSAHCAIQAGESTVISLGDYDLLAANRRKLLYPEYRTLAETIIHPGYRLNKNDIAILRLSEAVNYNKFPHIGISCLPTHNLVYGNGDWECYVSGWPKLDHYDQHRVLTRIEVDFTSRQKCSAATSALTSGTSYGYSTSYYGGPGHHGRTSESSLLCVEAWEHGSCIDDDTAMLICKKSPEYLDNPFSRDYDYYQDNRVSRPYGSLVLTFLQQWRKGATRILNSYVQERSDNDRWYLLGIGAGSNSCDGSSDVMLFEPVHEHMAFIHTNVDLTEHK